MKFSVNGYVSPNLQYKEISASEELVETRKAQLDQKQTQMFKTMSNQMRVPVALRDILPVGVIGVFCAIAIFMMLGCDSSYLHSWSGIIVQDIVLPLRKQPLTPKTQLFLLRLCIVGIAVYAYIFSLFFGQVTYILMFLALTGAVWLGGAGAVIIGGLYWKKGTTAAAWTTVIVGGLFAAAGFLGTQYWVDRIYPTLAGYPETLRYVTAAVESTSKPFEPIIMWRVTPDKFPLNGQEIFFLTMACSILSYVAVSLLTCKENFNMDRMLHRGQYRRKDEGAADSLPEKRMGLFKRFIKAFVGIDADYTKGDRILAWSVFLYSICWGFGTWLIVVLWNIFIFRWPDKWWSVWSFIGFFVISVLIGAVSTVWFFVGTTLDLKKMFIRLAARERNEKDDGRVIGHVSADEVEVVERIDQVNIKDQ